MSQPPPTNAAMHTPAETRSPIRQAQPTVTISILVAAMFLFMTPLLYGQQVTVRVESEYKSSAIQPALGSSQVTAGQTMTFKAPAYIFLNRFLEELSDPGNPENEDQTKVAYYRARHAGYTVNGGQVQGTQQSTAPAEVNLTITADTTFVWVWELEYAVFIESNQPSANRSAGNPTPAIGRHFYAKDTAFSARVNRSETTATGDSALRAASYELENFPGQAAGSPADRYHRWREVTGGGGGEATLDFQRQRDGMTIAWWGKIDKRLDSNRDQPFLYLYDNSAGAVRTSPIPSLNNERRLLNSMTIGVRPTGELFVEEVVSTPQVPTGEVRELASVPSGLVGLDWHHWAVVFDFPQSNLNKREIRLYRDGTLVLQRTLPIPTNGSNPVPTTDPSYKPIVLQAVWNRFAWAFSVYESSTNPNPNLFERLEGGLNNIAVWFRALPPDSANSSSVAAILTHARSTTAITGADKVYLLDGPPENTVTTESLPFPNTARTVLRTQTGPIPLSGIGQYADTQTVNLTDWLRVRWNWVGQVRYRFDALGDQTSGSTPFLEQAFVRKYSLTDPTIVETNYSSAALNNDVWVDIGGRVEIGAFYRTADRCHTLSDFVSAPSGDLGNLGNDISNLADVEFADRLGSTRVARVRVITAAANPTEAHFFYVPTTFRAEIPLGETFDALNPDRNLVPDLCQGGVLRAGTLGPSETFTTVGQTGSAGTGAGNPFRWDQVRKHLLPVRPGSYNLQWPDANDPNKSYKIQIVSGYPADTVTLPSEREDERGRREGSAPNYITSITLSNTAPAYPATPTAHYRHLFDSDSNRTPPTLLDLSATDPWKFQEVTYTDSAANAVANLNAAGVPFNASGNGRSVLLYSYRPNPDEIADGTLTEESLAVRVVSSSSIPSLLPNHSDSLYNPLRSRALLLDGTQGVVRRQVIPNPPINDAQPQANFVFDFWLNTGNLPPDAGPVQILTTGAGRLEVILDPATATITASYFGKLRAVHPIANSGSRWTHYVVHLFGTTSGSVPLTVLDFYAGGYRREHAIATALLPSGHTGAFFLDNRLSPACLRVGVGANPLHALQLDQLRLFPGPASYLTAADMHALREGRAILAGAAAQLYFDFETAPLAPERYPAPDRPGLTVAANLHPSFVNWANRTGANTANPGGIGLENAEPSRWVSADIQEVATRLGSPLDDAGFNGSGYILDEISNYNAAIYRRNATVGAWGAVFPVNQSNVYAGPLEIAYYENPNRTSITEHPNVAWPYVAVAYNDVKYPAVGPHKDKRIYIASRLGSEGVDRNGRLQTVFDAERYADLTIYNQPNRALPGYNPNEEHALVAPANRAALRIKTLGEDLPNNPPLAAFALQTNINVTTVSGFTSLPWVLVQVDNLVTGQPEMAAYRVEATRNGSVPFPRPPDAEVDSNPALAYEPAPNPEDRFLVVDPAEIANFKYEFAYTAAAGDLLIPPYPLNLVIGSATMLDANGHSVQATAGVNQRTLWRDVNGNAWVVSGDGRFFHRFFYPHRGDFHLPGIAIGTPVAWLPEDGSSFTGAGAKEKPVKVVYDTFWRSDYPSLKRGETLTYQGGEFYNENPGANGLPALVAMGAAEIVYDSATPSMIFSSATAANLHTPAQASARMIRPLDRREVPFTVRQMADSGFTPAARDRVLIIGERWYFKELPGSLQKRLYFDSLAEKLVFRGRLNDKESGDSELTSGPDPINTLEPNVMTAQELARIQALGPDEPWDSKINAIYAASQNPAGLGGGGYLSGFAPVPGNYSPDLTVFWKPDLSGAASSPAPAMVPLDSLGVGSALVPNPSLLTNTLTQSFYVTIAENNRAELNGAPVSLHVIEIIPDRYRGAIQVIEGADAFSERITLQHNGEFGANTDDLYYEWWIRDAAALDVVASEILPNGALREVDARGNSLWQEYLPKDRLENNQLSVQAKHLGLHSIVFEGRPDVVLADKLILLRYRHKDETNWRLVPFEIADPASAWTPGSPAPFQWAGAANSPQFQADGSQRYIPQLVMGWVKRVLDRINPYEARYTDFFSHESPATYSSQIQIAGPPYAGKVALNPDKNVIERTGLIELYETVLQRAKELSIDNSSNPVSTDGINQALLLAATRLAVLYELLGREAYSDAQDPTITVTTPPGGAAADNQLASVASFTHAFQGLESDLLNEELALLRGTDFRKSFPVYNRMFWNYTKGLGEAAYNVQYNIYDANTDGFVNEDDARILYPQGHGDSWGHFLSALGTHYALLQQPVFSWKARSELYALMQNVLEVDYLDERTFAKLAAAKARAGRDIVRGTYRLHYTYDPAGQWQGYTDGADPARAWGVSEWGHRAGQGAYFDWMVANSLLPAEAAEASPVDNPDNLDRLERSAADDEIGEIAAALWEVQNAMDEADKGANPLGFDSDAIAFDIDPTYLAVGSTAQIGTRAVQGLTHFEQIYERALQAGKNAADVLQVAVQVDHKLRFIADTSEELIVEALRQDLDYRNRLIEIFGRPYEGTIGFGKPYSEGYQGPDTMLYAYLDRTSISQIVPQLSELTNVTVVHFNRTYYAATNAMDNSTLVELYQDVWGATDGPANLTNAFLTLLGTNTYDLETALTNLSLPYNTASKYGFEAPDGWGRRTSYGRAQRALEEMLLAEIALDQAIIDYIGFLQDWEVKTARLSSELAIFEEIESLRDDIVATRAVINSGIVAAETALGIADIAYDSAEKVANAATTALPQAVGTSFDFGAVGRGIIRGVLTGVSTGVDTARKVKEIAVRIAELARDEGIAALERDILRAEQVAAFEGMVEELVNLSGADQPKRDAIGIAIQEMELKRQDYVTSVSEGFRLLREREAFNKVLAAKVQKNRYQDMIYRLSRNEAMSKYQTAFNHAARYTWLAAKAYDYETSLDPGHPAAATPLFDQIVKTRHLGQWIEGDPRPGQGGLAEILALLNASFVAVEGQIGLNSVQIANEHISLRAEHFRVGPPSTDGGQPASDDRWRDALKARLVDDLWQVPEFRQHCRPFADPLAGPQPGLVIRFRTTIEPGLNFFGRPLAAGDHAYSSSQFATRIATAGIFLDNYPMDKLATTPRAYLVPTGNDYFRISTANTPQTRAWSVRDIRIPTPFPINQSQLTSPGFIPTIDGIDGTFGELRRHADFQVYHDVNRELADDEQSTRLIARSIWNSEWILVIPGIGLHADPVHGLEEFCNAVTDLKLTFKTYSHNGQ